MIQEFLDVKLTVVKCNCNHSGTVDIFAVKIRSTLYGNSECVLFL